MADPITYWVGEIKDCPVDLPDEIKAKLGLCLLSNSRKDDVLYEILEYADEQDQFGREFEDFDMIPGLPWIGRKKCVAWVVYEKKPPELDDSIREMLMDLIVDDHSRAGIYQLMTLAPWTIQSLGRYLKTIGVLDPETEEGI